MRELANRTAVVTGAAGGIGLGIARSLLGAGMRVMMADIDGHLLGQSVAELQKDGADVAGVVCDVSDPDAVEGLRKETLHRFGEIQLLCNNAGVLPPDRPVWEYTANDWTWVLSVNLWGAINGIRTFVPHMVALGQPTHIVNTASITGLTPGLNAYSVSKHAVIALSEALLQDLVAVGAATGVSVLCPGPVASRLYASDMSRPPGLRNPEGPARRTPQSNSLRPEVIGDLVVAAVQEGRFYIVPGPETPHMAKFGETVQMRLGGIAAALHGGPAPEWCNHPKFRASDGQ